MSPVKTEPGVELNRRGIPARKRKKNSLIFGDDDLVSLPIRSPRKKAAASATKPANITPQSSNKKERQQRPKVAEKEVCMP
jgi:hypothetical protein